HKSHLSSHPTHRLHTIMAASTLQTKTISSEKFVESCGAILFDLANLSDIKVCLIQHKASGEWLFAKGRRNQNESRKDAAIREVMEETGFRCRLLPLTMATRATPADAHADVPDKAQVCENLAEPFMCQIRTLKGGKGTKIIWWFIAALEGDMGRDKLPGEDNWLPTFEPWRSALNTLTFQNDRELLQKALSLLQMT
ncbi:NUDIX domain-containing protein, partial [Karstenula rhodostoma CBS 690.94]